MGKSTICIGKNKGADQLRSNCEADQRLCFCYHVLQFLFFLSPKFPASSHLMCLYRPVCVGPGWKPNCWFSHAQAHILLLRLGYFIFTCHPPTHTHCSNQQREETVKVTYICILVKMLFTEAGLFMSAALFGMGVNSLLCNPSLSVVVCKRHHYVGTFAFHMFLCSHTNSSVVCSL